jgi:uncharacterized membrane protein YkoI
MSEKVRASSAIIVLFIILSVPAICMSEGRPVVCDRLYYDGNEGNSAYNISGKFLTLEMLSDYLDPMKEIGEFGGKRYRLYDILVKADFNGGGFFVEWQVSGPKPLIEKYLEKLEKGLRDKTVFYDLSKTAVDLKTTAFYETEDAFSIGLSSSKYSYKPGEEIIVWAKVKNNMNTPALLVRCLDGSARGFRYPQCVFEIKDSSGKTPENIFAPMCKVVNPLTPDEFIDILPGESAELFDGGFVFSNAFKLVKPGKYYIFIRYSTVALKEWEWYGMYSDEYWNSRNSNEFWKKREKEIIKNRELLKKIELVSIKSNTIEIEISGNPLSRKEAIRIAEEACKKSGWKFNDVTAGEDDGRWVVRTNTKALGMNATIVIDKYTGVVVEKNITGP